MRRYDDGSLAHVIAGDGTLAVTTEPEGAEAVLYRFVPRDGVLTPEEERPLGPTPIGPIELPMGSYLLVLRSPGFREVRYPVHISRKRQWRGMVRLRTDEEIGEGFVYVPGGPFVYGDGKDARVRKVADFAIARYPVTYGEYAEFLDAIPEEEAAEHLPRTETDGPMMEKGEDGRYRPKAELIDEEPYGGRYRRDFGEDFLLLLPVVAVSFDDAAAYCRWKTKATGREWRLPTEEEREKAARGVDGRRFPWGDLRDSSLAKCQDSRPEPSQPEPVGAFPTAVSVYGMGDAAGNVWDWTDSWFDDRSPLSVLRGGSWNADSGMLRSSVRSRLEPRTRLTLSGFRGARSLR